MGRLISLELENFKSYKGKHIIEPFSDFTAIVGLNGSGKSNLMDAISFVLGERTAKLRAKQARDLIHGAITDKPSAKKCYVKMNFQENGQIYSFMRSVTVNNYEYSIDSETVTAKEYSNKLEQFNILVKAKNFLIYQGEVERMTMRSPKELMEIFEEISRSNEYKKEFDRLKAEKIREDDLAKMTLSKQRNMAIVKQEAVREKKEATKYEKIKDDLRSKESEMYLMKLFYLDKELKNANERWNGKNGQLRQIVLEKEEREKKLKLQSNEHNKLMKKANTARERVAKKTEEVNEQKNSYAAAKQKTLHVRSKLETAKKMHKAVREAAEKYENNLATTRKKITELETKKAECKASHDAKSRSLDLQLSESQVSEYNQLKGEAIKRCGVLNEKLRQLLQQKSAKENVIQFYRTKFEDFTRTIENKKTEVERNKRMKLQLEEKATSVAASIEAEQNNLTNLQQQVNSSREQLTNVERELSAVQQQLADVGGLSEETQHQKRRTDAVNELIEKFPDRIYGRLLDLCHPSHERFNLAVTKVLGNNMMAIVCDTDETAHKSIAYLKEKRFDPETFLPISILSVEKVNEKLRQLNEEQNTKLVYDIIECTRSEAKKAVLYACGNTLVCDTVTRAKQFAYGDETGLGRQRVVVLDGTLFERNGIISGGGENLKARSKKWDEKTIRALKGRFDQLSRDRDKVQRSKTSELHVDLKKEQLRSLGERQKCVANELDRIANSTAACRNEIESITAESIAIKTKLDEVQRSEGELEEGIKEVEQLKNSITDEVFSGFCQRMGIANIREYERREMSFLESMQREIDQFDIEIDRNKIELNYLSSVDKRVKEKLEQEKVEELTNELNNVAKKQSEIEEKMKRLNEELMEISNEYEEIKTAVDQSRMSMGTFKKDTVEITRRIAKEEKELASIKQEKRKIYHRRRLCLEYCKLNDLNVPFQNGTNLSDIDVAQLTPPDDDMDEAMRDEYDDFIAQIVISFDSLDQSLKKFKNSDDAEEKIKSLSDQIDEIRKVLKSLSAPHVKTTEWMDKVNADFRDASAQHNAANKRAKDKHQQFMSVSDARYHKFQECFKVVAESIDSIYKELNGNNSAQAILMLEGEHDSYDGGIIYNCVVPNKRLVAMQQLSGGEKTIASIALLFAMHRWLPSPFLIMDEVDAALDNTNIRKVATFLKNYARSKMQNVTISLKEELYKEADVLLGVYAPSPGESAVLSFDLKPFSTSSPTHMLESNRANILFSPEEMRMDPVMII